MLSTRRLERQQIHRAMLVMIEPQVPEEEVSVDASVDISVAQWRKRAEATSMDRADFDQLCSQLLGVSPASLYAWSDQVPAPEVASKLSESLQLCAQGCPVALVLGHAPFMGHKIAVDNRALIPRDDSQVLVEAVLGLPLEEIAGSTPRAIELGVGSGALLVALASECPDWSFAGIDQSEEALLVARQNVTTCLGEHVSSQIPLWQSDWCQSLHGSWDCIFSNPPYVESSWIRNHPALHWEPRLALDGGADGMDHMAQIICQAPKWLRASGWLVLEHGNTQRRAVRALLEASGHYDCIQSLRDARSHHRVVRARRSP